MDGIAAPVETLAFALESLESNMPVGNRVLVVLLVRASYTYRVALIDIYIYNIDASLDT